MMMEISLIVGSNCIIFTCSDADGDAVCDDVMTNVGFYDCNNMSDQVTCILGCRWMVDATNW